QRAGKPMVTVNAGGLSEGVFESELFGHVKGAFTDARNDRVGRFELAEGSTLFLDEIANVPATLQAKLLRVLQTGELERVGSSRTHRVGGRGISPTNARPPRCSPSTSCAAMRRATPKHCRASSRTRCSRCSIIRGPATCASWIT